MKRFYLVILIMIIPVFLLKSQEFWQLVNGIFGASSRDVKYSQDGMIYLATESSGVFRSEDNGKSWISSLNDINYSTVEYIAVSDKGEVFIGTFSPVSIFYSNDNGNRWINYNLNMKVQLMAPQLFALNGEIFAKSYPDYLHKLSDDGTEWIKVSGVDDNNGDIKSMCYTQNTMFAGATKGLFKSLDNGDNWEYLNNSISSYWIRSLGFDLSGNLYASTLRDGFYHSSDLGDTWQKMSTNSPSSFCADKNETLFGSFWSDNISKSTDKGKTWIPVFVSPYIMGAIEINKKGVLICTSQIGPYMSTDGGNNWNLSDNGLIANQVAVQFMLSDGTLLAGNEMGLYRSENNSKSWEKIISRENDHCVSAIDTNSQGDIYTIFNKKLYISKDKGDTWKNYKINNFYSYWDDIKIIEDTVYIADSFDGVLKSNDLKNWEIVTNGLPLDPLNGNHDIRKICVLEDKTILACPCQAGIYRTSDGGRHWIKSDKGLGDVWVMDIVVRYQDNLLHQDSGSYQSGDIFAVTTYGSSSYGLGIYRSSDNGLSWEIKSVGLYSRRFFSLVIANNGHLFAGAFGQESNGVYESSDNGETWVLLPTSGLPKKSIVSLLIGNDGYLYAGISGNSLFRTSYPVDSSGWVGNIVPEKILEASIDPHPVSDISYLKLYINYSSDYLITLYDLKGKKINNLAQGHLNNSEVAVPITTDGLALGTYFIFIDTKWIKKTIKLQIVK